MTKSRLLPALLTLAVLAAFPACSQGADNKTTVSEKSTVGEGKVVALDEYYNHQLDKSGKPFHYIWSDTKNSGFSKFGQVFKNQGATITSIDHAPTAEDLKKVSVYIICNPASIQAAPGHKPNFISEPAISTIADWVKGGGVLLMMANSPNWSEIEHFNNLAEKFGMKFDGNMRNTAPSKADHWHACFTKGKDDFVESPLWDGIHMIYMKEISSIAIQPPAKALLIADKDPKESVKTEDGAGPGKDVIVAEATVGKGYVLAVGDPWVYNEYIDQTWPPKLPVQEHQAAVNMSRLLLGKASAPEAK